MPPPPILLPVFTLGFHHEPAIEPTEWIPASVPGAVQLDWARAHDWPEWWRGDEWKRYRWMEDVWWTYRTSFAPPSLHPGERLRLVLCGIDHSAEVRLNGTGLARHTGMQTPLVVDLTPHLQPHNELRVTIQPAPKSRATPENRRQANATTKAAVSYTWDFHPRLIPLGLSRAATMEVIRTDGLESAELACEVAADLASAHLTLAVGLRGAATNRVRWRVWDPRGQLTIDQTNPGATVEARLESDLKSPVLWWPHDQGEPALYRWEVELVDAAGITLDRRSGRFGAQSLPY
jgi:beta-mannosidase